LSLSAIIFLPYLIICLFLILWQTRIIFSPQARFENIPQDYQFVHEEVILSLNKNEYLQGWWLPSTMGENGVILYLHGNASNVGGNLGKAKHFLDMGFSVLLMDYRGYGQSLGDFPHEKQVYQDAQMMYDYLIQSRQIKPDNLLIFGHSLGGAIAIELARKNPAAGLIVEGSFTSILNIANRQKYYRFIPLKLLLHQRFASLEKLPQLLLPSLFIHGAADEMIPVAMAEQLYAAAPHPKQLLIVPDAHHTNVATTGGDRYKETIRNFHQLTQNKMLY
jgi:fermentation-respiration switch protein FrsA (DUF1100 family)